MPDTPDVSSFERLNTLAKLFNVELQDGLSRSESIEEKILGVAEGLENAGVAADKIDSVMTSMMKLAEKTEEDVSDIEKGFNSWGTSLSKAMGKIPLIGGQLEKNLKGPLEDAAKVAAGKFGDALHAGKSPMRAMATASRSMAGGMWNAVKGVQVFGMSLSLATGGLLIAIGAVVMLIKMFMDFSKSVRDFSGSLGVSTERATALAAQTKNVGAQTKMWGVKTEDIVASQKALAASFKTVLPLSDGIVKSATLLSAKTDLSAESAADLMRSYDLGGKDAGKAMDKLAKNASKAGVPFKAIAEDLGKNVDLMYEFGVEALEKAAISARKFGLELKDAAGVANKFLDPMEAINKANRLNLLFGTELNGLELQRMANTGDMAGLMETLNEQLDAQGKSFSDLTQLEKQALTEATGLSNERVAALMKEGELQDEITGKTAETMEEALSLKDSTSLVTQVTGSLSATFDKLSNVIMPTLIKGFDKIKDPINAMANAVSSILSEKSWDEFKTKVTDTFTSLLKWVGKWAVGMAKAVFGWIPSLFNIPGLNEPSGPLMGGGTPAGAKQGAVDELTRSRENADRNPTRTGAGIVPINVVMNVDGQPIGNVVADLALG